MREINNEEVDEVTRCQRVRAELDKKYDTIEKMFIMLKQVDKAHHRSGSKSLKRSKGASKSVVSRQSQSQARVKKNSAAKI